MGVTGEKDKEWQNEIVSDNVSISIRSNRNDDYASLSDNSPNDEIYSKNEDSVDYTISNRQVPHNDYDAHQRRSSVIRDYDFSCSSSNNDSYHSSSDLSDPNDDDSGVEEDNDYDDSLANFTVSEGEESEDQENCWVLENGAENEGGNKVVFYADNDESKLKSGYMGGGRFHGVHYVFKTMVLLYHNTDVCY